MSVEPNSKALNSAKHFQRDRDEFFDNVTPSTRALLALDAGRMGCWSINIGTNEIVGDRFDANLLGLNYDEQPWTREQFYKIVHPDDLDHVKATVAKALSGVDPNYNVDFRKFNNDPNAPVQWLGARGQVTEWDEHGNPLRIVGVNWDATEQKIGEQKLTAMAAEMDHRVKNAFAVIRALINLGNRTTDSKDEFVTTLRSQVEAMAMAHAVSARMARTTADADSLLNVHDIISSALAPWLGDKIEHTDRVKITCDPSLTIHPRKVSPLAMVLYELSTNATKYGPLSTDTGHIDISVHEKSGDEVLLIWSETSDPPPNESPTQSGFGTVLLDNCAINLGGAVHRDMKPEGLYLELRMNVAG